MKVPPPKKLKLKKVSGLGFGIAGISGGRTPGRSPFPPRTTDVFNREAYRQQALKANKLRRKP